MDGALVRISGQPIPPSQPPRGATWCAFAFTDLDADVNPSVIHDGAADAGLGTSTYSRTEALSLVAHFYGPHARAAASRLRDNIALGQNRAALRPLGLAFVRVERLTGVPELQNLGFVRRTDLVIRFRRAVSRTYAIRNVVGLQGAVAVDAGSGALIDPLGEAQ